MKLSKLKLVVAMATVMTLGACAMTQGTGVATQNNSPAKGFVVPAYERLTLDNGLTLFLMPQKEVPLITVNAVVRAGSVNDSTAGIASMTAQGLLLGAAGRSKSELEQTVDFLGASLSADAGKEGSVLAADFMAKDTEVMLPLFANVLMRPDFNSDEFAKLQQREIAGLSQAKESPRAVIGRYFDKLVFGQHPYGNAGSGTRESLATLNADALRAFHANYYLPGNTAISVVGDFDPASMKQRLQALFGGWHKVEGLKQPDLKAGLPKLDKSRVLLVDKGDAIETTFLIGSLGISRDNPDYVGLSVVNTILGGRFTSWLNDELRVNAGLTYGAHSGFVPYSSAGVFQISTFTKMATTEQAIDLALKTYARLWEQGIDKATLDSAKAYVKGQFPPKFETAGQLAGLLSDMYLYGFDDSFINEFQQRVDGLTLAEAQRLVASYFPRENLQFVLIGNAAEIAPIAAKYGEVIKVNIQDVGFGN
ncbi:M16 family metallopeptidase [Shewanella cyperi]|uniref:Insulinase family protein n=1 Tax=Shewanella cyperi TaxID=2814292 RepID=A0A974XK57_9GAMM|nr:pitrilysin family protein [Shewanella cyperi]QSX29930.1 insulinase family protein [Shewanella cyperi]QSX40708.1 insulinase family protein [Shewanella cyperi]